MKKTLVSALTTALVVGAASTTFAAANPFSDVPTDSWAYDAVTQLAADGVIEGYPDGTFQGQKNITRYEMAQMIAKAMAKTDVSAADKALIDKLAAEFADELNNLGVRVSNLERNADMVKWTGQARYTYIRHNHEGRSDDSDDDTNETLLRLEPSAEVNDHWHVNARLDLKSDFAKDDDGDNVKLKRAWAQGNYDNFQVKLGKFATRDEDSIMDTNMSGAEVTFGSKTKLTLGAGRLDSDDIMKHTVQGIGEAFDTDATADTDTTNYYFAGVDYANGKFAGGVHYHYVNIGDLNVDLDNVGSVSLNDVKGGIIATALGYKFDKNHALSGLYAHSNIDLDEFDDNIDKNAWFVQYNYKGAEAENAGTWGAWAAYRHLGAAASPFVTYDTILDNEKGWEIGANYTFAKNIVGTVQYANGKRIDLVDNNDGFSTVFGRLQFFF